MNFDSVGKNIRNFRLSKKLRQEDLAEKTGLSANYIGMLERGEKVPSLETFVNIINILGVSADMVLAEVVDVGYKVKDSMLDEKLSSLPSHEREKIYEVIDILIKHSNIY